MKEDLLDCLKKLLIILVPIIVIIAGFVYRLQSVQPLESVLFPELKRPIIVAHRGGKDVWPENTMYAFERAVKLGVDVLELDVHPTSDGHIVVIHDATVDRTSNGSGSVDQMTLEELKQLDFAYHFVPPKSNTHTLRDSGITISTLETVLQKFSDAFFNIEIKHNSVEFAQKVIESIQQNRMAGQVLVASFHQDVMTHLRSNAPEMAVVATRAEIKKMVLLSKIGCAGLLEPNANVFEVPVKRNDFQFISAGFIKSVHAKGQGVYAFTINDSTEMRTLLDLGVDAIVTDRPYILKMFCIDNKVPTSKRKCE
jgi:glycerophosphoryl diester phosphodiesterase